MSDNEVAVSIGGEVDPSLAAAAAKANATLATIPASMKDLQDQVAATAANVETQTEIMMLGFEQLTTAIEKSSQAAATSTQSITRSVRSAGGAATESGKEMEGFGLKTAAARRELIVLAHEAATGNWRRFAGSLMVMAERMDAMSLILSPVGLGILAIGAAVAAVGIAMVKGGEEWRAYNGALEATNNAAGLTKSDFNSMADSFAAAAHGSIGDAREELQKLILTGQFTGDTMRLVGDDAAIMGRLTGDGADKFVAEFARMGDDVASFAVEYEKHYHQITLAQFQHIEALQRAGEVEQAQHALAQDVYEYLGNEATQKLGYLESAWKGVTSAIGGAWEAMKSWGREKTPVEQLSRVNDDLEAAYRAKNQGDPGAQGDIDELQARAAALTKTIQSQDALSKSAAETAANQTKGVTAAKAWADQLDKAKEGGNALAHALSEIKNEYDAQVKATDPNDKAALSALAQQRATLEAQARKTNTPHASTKGQESAFGVLQEDIQAQTASLTDWSADAAPKLEAAFWANRLAAAKKGSTEYHQIYEAERRAQNEVDKSEYQSKLEADKAAIAGASDVPEKLKAAWEQYLSDMSLHYRADSKEYLAAVAEKLKADEEAMRKRREQQAQLIQTDATSAINAAKGQGENKVRADQAQQVGVNDNETDGVISRRKALAETLAIDQQILVDRAATAAKVFAIEKASIEAQNALQGTTAAQVAQNNQKLAADQQAYWTQLKTYAQEATDAAAKANEDAAKRTQQAWSQSIGSVVTTFGNGLLGMARGTTTFQAVGMKAAEDLENQWVGAAEKKVTAWLAGETQQTAATIAGNTQRGIADQAGAQQSLLVGLEATLKKVTQNAVAAASAAYSALAGIPIVGPELGAAAAAVTFTAVEAFGALASASGGYDIPSGVNPLVQAHAREMILPASISDGFRSIIAGQSGARGGSSSGGLSRGGDTYNLAVGALDSRSMRRAMDNPRAVRDAARAFARHS